jgi:hypothetical protein
LGWRAPEADDEAMGASWKELREVCQRPVRAGNDVAGLLFGDHASLLVTKLFVDLRLSPNYASIGFLLCGLAGAALQCGRGAWALAASVLLVLYYVLDCVDGEVARWQKVVNTHWGYFDYLFHMLIKPLVFLGVAVGCRGELGGTAVFVLAFCAAVATLWRKILIEIPGILFLKDVLRRNSLGQTGVTPAAQLVLPAASSGTGDSFRLRFDLMTLRAVLTNFDIGLLLLTAATAIDLFVALPALDGIGQLSARALWLAYYGVVLPLDFLDYLLTYLRRRHFSTEMSRLLSLAHHFRAEAAERNGDGHGRR